jgi:hypothetical protein
VLINFLKQTVRMNIYIYIYNSVPTSQKTSRLATRLIPSIKSLILIMDKKLPSISIIVRKPLVYSGKKIHSSIVKGGGMYSYLTYLNCSNLHESTQSTMTGLFKIRTTLQLETSLKIRLTF